MRLCSLLKMLQVSAWRSFCPNNQAKKRCSICPLSFWNNLNGKNPRPWIRNSEAALLFKQVLAGDDTNHVFLPCKRHQSTHRNNRGSCAVNASWMSSNHFIHAHVRHVLIDCDTFLSKLRASHACHARIGATARAMNERRPA